MEKCVITHGASGDGYYNRGGYNYGISSIISDTIIRHNPGRAVTVYGTGGNPVPYSKLTDCLFEHNFTGGLHFHCGTHNFVRCIIRHNGGATESGSGAGGTLGAGVYDFYNCLVYDNHSAEGIGGAFYKYNASGSSSFNNCTIAGNSTLTAYMTGGIRVEGPCQINNSIIRFNYAKKSIEDWYRHKHQIAFTNTCSTSDMPGTGNFSDDPEFLDFENFDLRLSRNSPCVDAGTNMSWMTGEVDIAGNPRIDTVRGIVDVGCYEYQYAGALISIR